MRRVNVWLLVPAVLLALGVGVLVGRAVDDDNGGKDTASGKPTKVLGVQITTTTTEAETTTSTAAASATTTTPTTVKATTATTQATTATTAAPVTTTTTRRPAADSACGSGTAGASASLVVTGGGPPFNPTYTYSGPVSVTNNTGKAIEITSLVLRLSSSDGTFEDVAVAGAAGTVLETGTTRDFSFTHQTSHPPKENGAAILKFSYKPPGGTTDCAST